jgi:hypothetical protein
MSNLHNYEHSYQHEHNGSQQHSYSYFCYVFRHTQRYCHGMRHQVRGRASYG